MTTFKQRVCEGEIMDQPGLDVKLHRQALNGLSRVNWWSHTASHVWGPLQRLAEQRNLDHLRVLDLACGGGDVTLQLLRRSRAAGLAMTIHGWDKSPTAVGYATEHAERCGLSEATFYERDVLNEPIGDEYDAVICTLFLHHLQTSDAGGLLSRMHKAARQIVVIDDLRRTRLGYWLAWVGCRIVSRSSVVHTDGPLSVQAAFSLEEVRQMAEAAGMTDATLVTHWPQRFTLTWVRP